MIRQFIRRVIPHQYSFYKDRLFRRVNERKLAETLVKLGVAPGQIVYIQSSFGSLGYYPDGAQRFIKLLKQMAGPRGTIVMPSFPSGGAMQDYVTGRPVYDARQTPSAIGLLPEVMRQLPGVRRSCHPTHPVVAMGFAADEIVSGHEDCASPQGDGSPFDKIVRSGALVLRINTHSFPLCHRLQEIVDWPNLFLPDPVTLDCISDAGSAVQVTTRVYRKQIPFVLFLPGKDDDDPIATNIVDFPLLFHSREKNLYADPEKAELLKLMLSFRSSFEAQGRQYIRTSYNGCMFDAFHADHAMKFAVIKARELIDRYRSVYNLEAMTQAMATGLLSI